MSLFDGGKRLKRTGSSIPWCCSNESLRTVCSDSQNLVVERHRHAGEDAFVTLDSLISSPEKWGVAVAGGHTF